MASGSHRAFGSRSALFAGIGIVWVAGYASAGDPGPRKPVSPSTVLARAEKSAGSRSVSFPRSPRDASDPGADRTLSPYFHVAGSDPATERLPLKQTSADVQIAGVIARVKVRQLFENNGRKPIEAVYVFPASTRAAVHGMRMKIGQRTIEAKIDRRQAAREDYEAARAQGRRASLLEQERPNVFTMSVANVMPRDRIEVELDYSEMLVPDHAVYEFVYPTVVGPRYGGGADPVKDRWIANPHLGEGEKEPYKFDIAVHLETGIPLKELSSPSHKVDVRYASRTSADVRLQEPGGGNKDYILRYRLAGDRVETGLLMWQGGAAPGQAPESFFALMMEPPQRPTQAQIPPREYIFLLDVSGSMHGFPLDTAKALMKDLLSNLRPTDQFNLALFSGANYVMSPEGSLPATPANIRSGIDLVLRQTGGGGTELMGGLQASYGIPKRDQGVSRTVVVVTDGYVGVEAQAFKLIRERLHQANLFAFGIGTSVNRGLIEGMARAGQGEPFVVLRADKAKAEAEKLREYIEKPVLTNIGVALQGFDAYEVAPAKLPDLMARRPLVLFGKFRGAPGGKIEVTGMGGGGSRFRQAIDVQPGDVRSENAPLRSLWARRWVATLDDELQVGGGKDVEDAITDLGLQYSLLTSFTSFVAIDSQIANRSAEVDTVRQPLPMPEGVSNMAIEGKLGKSIGSAYGVGGMGLMGQGSGGGGSGYGRGMGAIGASKPVAPAPVAAPKAEASAKRKSPARLVDSLAGSLAGRSSRERPVAADEEKVDERQRSARRLVIVDMKAAHLGDAKPLVQAIEAQLAAASSCATDPGTVSLRLTIDKTGKVVKVEVLSGSKNLASCLQAKVASLVTATNAVGTELGTYEVTIKSMQ